MAAVSRATPQRPSLDDAYAYCAGLARTHYENFTVVSFLLPKGTRRHMQALYAFCRHTDDLGDEAPGDRLVLLDAWESELRACYNGAPSHPIMVALQDTIRRFDVPDAPFLKLVEANRMDQRHVRFPTYDDLVVYCDHSANPVGRMVLYVAGDRSEESHRLSDFTCTALQLANFWQDVHRDYAMDRVYLPMEDMARFGYTEDDLARNAVNDRFRALLRFEVDRAQALFEQGLPLVGRLHGRLRFDVALFSQGGMRVLDAIREQNYNVLRRRPVVSRKRKLLLMLSTLVRLAVVRRP